MMGLVFEWSWDWYGAYVAYAQTDPKGAVTGTGRVIRGGGVSISVGVSNNYPRGSAIRSSAPPSGSVSFRLVRGAN